MRWLLTGYCGLVLISVSVCSQALEISQTPRYAATKIHKSLTITCAWPAHQNVTVEWYKAPKYNERKEQIQFGRRIHTDEWPGASRNQSILKLKEIQKSDSGVYFCRINGVWGSGTGVHVGSPVDYAKAQRRTQMKDVLIILQGLLLTMCLGASLLRQQKLNEKKDCVDYEEPLNDHIYEGLMIETCGGGLYEDLSMYAQPEGAEAPWE